VPVPVFNLEKEFNMNMRHGFFTAIAFIAAAGVCHAVDTIKLTKGAVAGKVINTTPAEVELEQGPAGSTKQVAVNQIQAIFYDNDPTDLKSAKNHVLAGRYAEGKAALDRIKKNAARPAVQQDIEFYRAFCAAKLALSGSGKPADAEPLMKAFIDANDKSYHYFEALEIEGDLLAADGRYGPATQYYARLQQAPWPDYKMRAGVASGRALLAQGKIDEAQNAFDKVIATQADDELALAQQSAAKLGKARAWIAAKNIAEGVKIAEDILKAADADDEPLQARAYNVLGTAYRQSGEVQKALLAFLRVDLLYSNVPDAHAEALANLAELWEQARKMDRAAQARKTLKEKYPNSPWAK
jgi:tetratricopeptide (TPR) repeat protein